MCGWQHWTGQDLACCGDRIVELLQPEPARISCYCSLEACSEGPYSPHIQAAYHPPALVVASVSHATHSSPSSLKHIATTAASSCTIITIMISPNTPIRAQTRTYARAPKLWLHRSRSHPPCMNTSAMALTSFVTSSRMGWPLFACHTRTTPSPLQPGISQILISHLQDPMKVHPSATAKILGASSPLCHQCAHQPTVKIASSSKQQHPTAVAVGATCIWTQATLASVIVTLTY